MNGGETIYTGMEQDVQKYSCIVVKSICVWKLPRGPVFIIQLTGPNSEYTKGLAGFEARDPPAVLSSRPIFPFYPGFLFVCYLFFCFFFRTSILLQSSRAEELRKLMFFAVWAVNWAILSFSQ